MWKIQPGLILVLTSMLLLAPTIILPLINGGNALEPAVSTESVTLFSDDFESGSLNAWTGNAVTQGETTSIADTLSHHGSRSLKCTSNGEGFTERAYVRKNIAEQSEVYARGYFNIQSGLPLQTVDNRFNILVFLHDSNPIASLGVRHTSVRDAWSLTGNFGTWTNGTSGPSMNRWYCVELYLKVASTGGAFKLWVDGDLVLEGSNINTAIAGNVNSVRTGLAYAIGATSSLTLYTDCIAISSNRIGTEELPQNQLTISIEGSGSTNPVPGTQLYVEDTSVQVTAKPASGYFFSGWLLDGVSMPNRNPIEITMNTDHNLTPIFTINPPYQLTVSSTGSGTTNPTGTAEYAEDSSVNVIASANANWRFDHWMKNGTNVGSINPYVVSMTSNWDLVAVFVQAQGDTVVDGFESGVLGAWSTPTPTSGEKAGVTMNAVYEGKYAAVFTSNGGGGYERAYISKVLNPTWGTVDVQGVFLLSQNGVVDNGDRVKLIELRSGNTIIACAGFIERNGLLKWWLESRDGTSYVETYSSQAITGGLSNWFTVKLQWVNNASNGNATLWVNGIQTLKVSGDNTSAYGNCSSVRIGMPELYNCGTTSLLLDNVVISTNK